MALAAVSSRHHVIEVPVISPVANSVPPVVDEIANGKGDILTADKRCRCLLRCIRPMRSITLSVCGTQVQAQFIDPGG